MDIDALEARAVSLLARNTRQARLEAAQLLTQRAWLQEQARIDGLAVAERPALSVVRRMLGEGEE